MLAGLWGSRYLRRFARAKDGTTAVEFALIAAPFFMLLAAIFETSAIYFASSTLENAVSDASRQIRTGQAQFANMTAAQFRQLICNGIDAMLKCDTSLAVDVRSFNDFQQVSFPNEINPDGTLKNDQQFTPGGAGDVVVVRVFYQWPIITPWVGGGLSNMTGNVRLIESVTTFRNEPFGSLLAN